jgi:Bacterial PH domain
MVKPARFRHNVSISIAGLVAFLGAVPIASSGFGREGGTPAWAYPLLLILLIPILVMVWGWRAGTDADRDGLRLRALFGSRRVPWSQVNALVPQGRKVVAVLADGGSIVLPAVAKADLPRLVAASGNELPSSEPAADEATADEAAVDETATDEAATDQDSEGDQPTDQPRPEPATQEPAAQEPAAQ